MMGRGPYSKCFLCRVWSWDACNSFDGATLCLPCYVDVLEVRQARGAMGEESPVEYQPGKKMYENPGRSPSPFRQLDLFD